MPESTAQLEARVDELTRRLARTQAILADLVEEWCDARDAVREREAARTPRPRGRRLRVVH